MNITYSIVRWVEENYIDLSHGLWPDPESEDTVSKRRQLSYHAPYESPCMLAGDIAARVKLCGRDGILMEKCCGMETNMRIRPSQLARNYHISYDEVVIALNRVTWFCTDEEFGKGLKYDEWKKSVRGNRKYRKPAVLIH